MWAKLEEGSRLGSLDLPVWEVMVCLITVQERSSCVELCRRWSLPVAASGMDEVPRTRRVKAEEYEVQSEESMGLLWHWVDVDRAAGP